MGKHNLMLIEDEESIRTVYKELFEAMQFNVVTFPHPLPAVEHFEKHRDIDYILTDNNMPYMTGIDFVKKIHPLKGNTHIILMSGKLPTMLDELEDLVRNKIIDGYIGKPLSMETLVPGLKDRRIGLYHH